MSATSDDLPAPVRQRLQPEQDPTRTITRRRRFRQAANKRWRQVRGDLRETIAQNDALHLSGDTTADRAQPQTLDDALAGLRPGAGDQTDLRPTHLGDDAAVAEWFRRVLNARVDTTASASAARDGDGWFTPHIREAYVRGMGLAVADARAAGLIEGDASQYDPTEAFTRDRHQRVFGRQLVQTHNDIENVADATHTDVVRTLGEALAAGVGARALADRLTGRVDAVGQTRLATVANTRVVDTVNRAIIEHADTMGATELGAAPEAGEKRGPEYQDHREATWATAGDSRVCAQCSLLDGRKATMEEIKKGNAPQPVWDTHPNCRCRWVVLG